MVWLGIPVGLWYVALFTMAVRGGGRAAEPIWASPVIVIATFGVVTMGGCIYRLSRGWRPATGGVG